MTLSIAGVSHKALKVWRLLKARDLPARAGISYFNFCIHCEVVYNTVVYEALVKFSREFRAYTSHKIAICVSTPLCPAVAKAPAMKNISLHEFGARVIRLQEVADVGYHGHFYAMHNDEMTQISKANYDRGVVLQQLRDEIAWFNGLGIHPKIYVAGWWFLTPDIVRELEQGGILVDTSIKKGRGDTFGQRYLSDEEVPGYGEPFILPPSKDVVEIQSTFGPVMPPFIMRGHVSQYLESKKARDLFFIFPLHDWDIPKYYRNIMSNVRVLHRPDKGIGWMDILTMRDAYLNEGAQR